jgi:hypothetical protein
VRNPEIFPFLGSTRLEGPINRFNAALPSTVMLTMESRRSDKRAGAGLQRLHVMLKRVQPDRPWFRLVEITP